MTRALVPARARRVVLPRRRTSGPFASLANRQYRIFSLASLTSGTGLSVQSLARVWLVQDMTHSPFMVAMAAALTSVPMLLFGFFGGALSDRFDRKWIAVGSEALVVAGAALLAALVVSGAAQTWHVMLFAFLHGTYASFSSPAKQTLLADLVPQGQQRGAIGLSMVVGNLAGIAGPAIAAVLITQFGTGEALVAGTVISLAALPLFLFIRGDKDRARKRTDGRLVKNLLEGVRYVAGDPALRWLLLIGIVILIALSSRGVLYPALVQDVLGGGAGSLGMLEIAGGIGAVLGPVLAVSLGNRFADRRMEIITGYAFAGSVFAIAVSPWFSLTVFLAGLCTFTGTMFFVTNMTAFQLSAADEFRGRAVSVRFVSWGLQPVGMITLGVLAEIAGPQVALASAATVGALLFTGLVLLMRPRAARAASPQPA
ncbi:MAG: MFS transporter [Chloroflexi bacterium]|nr:MFS transporter [Chloroflexota bacterium]